MPTASEAAPPTPAAVSPVIADRYDRQLRLWSAREQQSLSEAHLVVLGATGPAIAALKNLILLGIKAITLVDPQRVRPAHLTENFFLLPSDCSEDAAASPYLAERTAFYLSQLNKDCACYYLTEEPEGWIQRFTTVMDPSFPPAAAPRQQQQQQGADRRREALLQLLQSAVRVPAAAAAPPAAPLAHVSALLVTDRVTDTHSLTSPLVRTLLHFVRAPFYLFRDGDSTQPPLPDAALKEYIMHVLHHKRSTNAQPAAPPPSCFSVYDCFAPCVQLPVFALSSSGMLASLQVLNEDTIVYNATAAYGKPTADLRFFFPFPELAEFFAHINPDDDAQFDSRDADKVMLHSHIPYTCLLFYALRKVMAAQPALFTRFVVPDGEAGGGGGGAGDVTEKNVVLSKEVLQAMQVQLNAMRRRQQPAQETFEEALSKLNASVNQPTNAARNVYRQLSAIFAAPAGDDDSGSQKSRAPAELAFAPLVKLYAGAAAPPTQAARLLYLLYKPREVLLYYILHSVKEFYEQSYTASSVAFAVPPGQPGRLGTHVLPFNGDLPDITTVTPWYNTMHGIYKRKHEADVETVVAMTAQKLWRDVLCEEAAAAPLLFTPEEQHHLRQYVHASLGSLAKEVVKNIYTLKLIAFDGNEAAEGLYEMVPADGHAPYTVKADAGVWEQHQRARAVHLLAQLRDAYERERDAAAAEEDGSDAETTALNIEIQSPALALAYMALQELRRRPAHAAEGGATRGQPDAVVTELRRLLGKDDPFATEGTISADDDGSETMEQKQKRLAACAAVLSTACREVERQSCLFQAQSGGESAYIAAIPSISACIGAITTQEVLKALFYKEVPETKQIVFNGYGNCLVKIEKD